MVSKGADYETKGSTGKSSRHFAFKFAKIYCFNCYLKLDLDLSISLLAEEIFYNFCSMSTFFSLFLDLLCSSSFSY